MDYDKIIKALSNIPEIENLETENAESKSNADLMSSAEVFAQTLRKIGVQQMRDSRQLLNKVTESIEENRKLSESIIRERERAVKSEKLNKSLINLLIEVFDTVERLVGVFEYEKNGMITSLRSLADYILREMGKMGVIPVGKIDEPFDPKVHDAGNEIPEGKGQPVITKVLIVGFINNGAVIRRSKVLIG